MWRVKFPTGKHNMDPLAILGHLQQLRAQRGKEIGLS